MPILMMGEPVLQTVAQYQIRPKNLPLKKAVEIAAK